MGIKESTLLDKARKGMRELVLYRVESGTTCPGIPDVHFCSKVNRVCGWVEFKAEDRWPTRVDLSREQVVWHQTYPGRSFVLLRFGDDLALWKGRDAALIADRERFGTMGKRVLLHLGGLTPASWLSIQRLITGGIS